jgi:hypothetical protein
MSNSHRTYPRPAAMLALSAVALAAVAVPLVWVTPAAGNNAEQKSLRDFMRKKLVASSRILEGLTVEDAGMIRDGAEALQEMSKAEMWNVLTDEHYREFNRDYRGSVRKLKEAAEKDNLDNATLQWLDTVKSCVECHKYVRSQRVTLKE